MFGGVWFFFQALRLKDSDHSISSAKREFPIHTIENIADLRAGILMPDRWSKRPSGEMIRWLAAAFTYDEGMQPDLYLCGTVS